MCRLKWAARKSSRRREKNDNGATKNNIIGHTPEKRKPRKGMGRNYNGHEKNMTPMATWKMTRLAKNDNWEKYSIAKI